MGIESAPSEQNEFCREHAELLIESLISWTGVSLVDRSLEPLEQARALYNSPCVVLSHDTSADPTLTYCNRTGLQLFGMSWSEMRCTPSRLTAEPIHQSARERMFAEVNMHGFVENYHGIRVSRDGRRFRIDRATVWNLLTPDGTPVGQAATFARWKWL